MNKTEFHLEPLDFETATLSPTPVIYRPGQAQGFCEPLTDDIALTMLAIPPGSFWMGSPEGEECRSGDEGPLHLVQLGGFLMGQTPITQAQWREVAGWEEREGEKWGQELKADPSYFRTGNDGGARPVERVSWHDAMEFCSRLSQRTGRTYTLPSEAQWEYACRAGTTTPFAFGHTLTEELANYNARETYANGAKGEYRRETTPVGSFPPNAWGLYDMHGNVWEWCLDHWHDSYEGAPGDGSAWINKDEEEGTRLLRGGSWYFDPGNCRSAFRFPAKPVNAVELVGFRVVCLPQGSALNP
jgi:formylglycine-generating enzyme required for sulfatase activity